MIREVIASQCGIRFDDTRVRHLIDPFETGTDPDLVEVDSDTDMSQMFHDQMWAPIWWFLEVLPLKYMCPNDQGVWRPTFG
jgi:hypothetical protein